MRATLAWLWVWTCAAIAAALPASSQAQPSTTSVERDREFAHGSLSYVHALTPLQIQHLARLVKVWGFLKYHHPQVASGRWHWDFELLRVLPDVLDANDDAACDRVLSRFIDRLGPLAPGSASLHPQGLALAPPLAWLDRDALGPRLWDIYEHRPAGPQFYVSAKASTGNPLFTHEPTYPELRYPDAGFQLLTLARYWNIIAYWFPYRDVIGEDWDDVLIRFLPEIVLARDEHTFVASVLRLIASVHDSHARLSSEREELPALGRCSLPAAVRFIDGALTMMGSPPSAAGGQRGDRIVSIDGVEVTQLTAALQPFYAASNASWLDVMLARALASGACGEVHLGVLRGSQRVALSSERVPRSQDAHDRPGPAFQRLSDDVAYIKLSNIKRAELPQHVAATQGGRGLVVDLRGYPAEFSVFMLGSMLVDRPTRFAKFTMVDLDNPGATHWQRGPTLWPEPPHYTGKVAILVDDATLSQAEYTALALRASPRAIVIGSTTAGADGDVSHIPLPFGLHTAISGLGVFHVDGSPTQRVGILPDVEVHPTAAGIREGRDEILERALQELDR